MTVIDIHTHSFTKGWLELLRKEGGHYNLKTRPDGQEEICRGDTPVVTPQKGHFDLGLRIRHMDEAGIDVAIVSLTCPSVCWGKREISLKAAKETNDALAEAQVKHKDRIRWLTTLPWEFPQAAISELTRTCDKGALGVMVMANVSGRSLTDPMFAPIWAEIDRRALPVLLHPTDAPGTDLMDMKKFDLGWSVGFSFDTTLAIARMIFDGFFDRYPNLKLIASHGGAALPFLVGVFEKGDEVEIPSRRRMSRKPLDYLRHIFYDSLTYDLGALRHLISVVGADRVMFGTDWPQPPHDTEGAFANTAALSAGECDAIRSGNARRMFGL